MGFCTRRYLFLSVCLLQIISVIERQVFDFLGFLWIPILVNFFEIIFIIFGFFGAYQYRPKYIATYITWHLFWLGWNVFVICLYLNVAGLDHKTNKVLKLDSKSESWWSNEGPGCKPIVPLTEERWDVDVENCFVNYIHVEIFQAGLQCFFALFGIIIGICLSRRFLEEDDTFDYEDAKGSEHLFLQPMYVSSNDNLNNYSLPTTIKSSNKYLNSNNNSMKKSQQHDIEFMPMIIKPLYAKKISGNTRKNSNQIPSDRIRVPLERSSSFDVLNSIHKSQRYHNNNCRPISLHGNVGFNNNNS